MRLLVIGAGYVGMALLDSLQQRGYDICVTTTQAERVQPLKDRSLDVFLFGPSDDEPFRDLVASCDAAVILVAPQAGKSYEETYLHVARKVSSALRGRDRPFYLLYTGSTSVYEGVEAEWATEDLPLNPHSENGRVLLRTEQLLLASADTCILRLGGIFGPGRELNRRARYFSGRETPGSGSEPTNHIHLEDIVAALLFCLDNRLQGVYNLVNGDHPTRRELYSSLCLSMSLPPPVWDDRVPSERKGYRVSNRKIVDAGFGKSFIPLN